MYYSFLAFGSPPPHVHTDRSVPPVISEEDLTKLNMVPGKGAGHG